MTEDKELKQEILDDFAKSQGYTTLDNLISDNNLESSTEIFTLKDLKFTINSTIQKLTANHKVEILRLKNQINHICPRCGGKLQTSGGNRTSYFFCQDCAKDEDELYATSRD